ncbi:type II and III secretion system protein, partial [Alphaproteobacteria bacterium]|nr:type II and III secretion system protein [Alphaproteobacteria bacterium]
SQILIEAKVLEVTLKEEYKSGIDWQRIGQYGLGNYTGGVSGAFRGDLNVSALFGTIAQKTPTVITTPETSQVLHIGGSGQSLSAILNFMEIFGVVRTLSSPRLTVLNNQTALLKVAENFVFFNVTGERQFLNSGASNYGSLVSANSAPQTIPIGFVMNVHPSIDPETNEVIINLRPTITRLIDTKQDPAVVLLNQSLRNPSDHIKSEFPVIAVREIDSILRIKSGAVAILGGLMIEGAETGKAGIPGTTDGPLSFFTASKRRAKSVAELVIFLRATILESPAPDDKDRDLYENFTMDSRRFNMEKVA